MVIRRRWRILAGLIAAAILLIVAGWYGATWHGQRRLTSQLEALNGAPVEIASIRIGWSSIELFDVRLLESGDTATAWMTVARMRLRMPIWQALAENAVADHVEVHEPRVYLRLDRDGNLLNRFGAIDRFLPPSESIEIRNGHVELRQEGRETLAATGIDLQIQGPAGELEIDGAVGQAVGAAWGVQATMDGHHLNISARLSCEEFHVDTNEMSTWPLVPRAPLEQVQVTGTTSVALTVHRVKDGTLDYHVEVQPGPLAVDLPKAGLRVQQVAGRLELTNDRITIQQVSGQLFTGQMTVDGQFDWRDGQFKGPCQATFNDIELSQLPRGWPMQNEVAGKLNGEANLQVAAREQRLSFDGHVHGQIEQARLFGLPTSPVRYSVDAGRLAYGLSESAISAAGNLHLELTMDEIAVGDVLPRLNLSAERLPVAVQGRAAVVATADLPLATLNQVETYRGQARISFEELSVGGTPLTEIAATARYADGTGHLDSLTGRFDGGGHFSGSGNFKPGGEIKGSVTIEQLPAALLVAWSGQAMERSEGTVSGEFQLAGSAPRWRSLHDWTVDGRVRSDRLVLSVQTWTDATAKCVLRQGMLSVSDANAMWSGTTVHAGGTIAVEAPHKFTAEFHTDAAAASDLLAAFDRFALPDKVDAQVALRGTASGQLDPLIWSAGGEGHMRAIELRPLKMPDSQFVWQADNSAVKLAADKLALYGGTMAVDAEMPFESNRPSSASVTLLGMELASVAEAAGRSLPIELAGTVDGKLQLQHFEDAERLTANGRLTGGSATWQSITVDRLAAEIDVQGGKAAYRLTGAVFDGPLEFSGQVAVDGSDIGDSVTGKLTLENAQLSRLPEQLRERIRLPANRLSGRVDMNLDLSFGRIFREQDFRAEGSGTIGLRELKWDRTLLAAQATGNLVLTPTAVQVRDFETTVAGGGGTIRGEFTAYFDPQVSGKFQFSATRLDSKRLLAAWPEAAEYVSGTFDAQLAGTLGSVWLGTARVATSRMQIARQPVRVTRVPIDWTYSPANARGRIRMRETRFAVAGGRVVAKASVDWGRTIDMTAEAQMSSLDTRLLLQHLPGRTQTASGRLNGKLELKGRNVRSLEDLEGSFVGTLDNAQAFRFPILQSLDRLLDAGRLVGTRFESGELKLRLSRAVVHVDRLALASSGVQLLVDGRATLGGRLDLNVAAHVGQFGSGPELRRLLGAVGLAVQPLASVALLSEANEFLSDRLLFFHVGGTFNRPITRIQAAPLLRQEAILFFLEKGTGLAL